jgi:hypothetical protein
VKNRLKSHPVCIDTWDEERKTYKKNLRNQGIVIYIRVREVNFPAQQLISGTRAAEGLASWSAGK